MDNLENLTTNVLTVSPGPKGLGGMASVIEQYIMHGIISRNVATHTKNPIKIIKMLVLVTSLLKFLYCISFDRKIKVVHIHSASYNSFRRKYLFFFLSKLFKKKIIFHIHGGEFHIFFSKSSLKIQRRIRSVLECCDYVFCLSKSWKVFFEQNFKCKNIYVINNIVNFVVQRAIPYSGDSQIILIFLGNIVKEKGIFDLLDVVSSNKDYLKAKIKLLVGGNGETKKLESYIVSKDLQPIVEFKGWVAGEGKKMLLSHAHVLILPSHNEGLPISVLEGMSYSLPVISTHVGGIPEIVDESNGILVEPGNKSEIFSAIDFFIKHPGRINKMGESSYSKVKKFFPSEVRNSIFRVYKELLNKA